MFDFIRRKSITPTPQQTIQAAIATEYAHKIQLAKNQYRNCAYLSWGFSVLPANGSQETEGFDVKEARRYIRKAEDSNAIIAAMLTKSAGNVTGGTGFKHQACTGDKALDQQIEKVWNEVCDDLDCTGEEWIQHQTLTVRGMMRDGDCGAVDLYHLPGKDGKPIKGDGIAPFEATDLMTPPDAQPHEKGNRIVDGIEFDTLGRPQWYYIRTFAGYGPVPASCVAYLPRKTKVSNSRGIPALAAVIGLLENINGLVEAEVVAARLNAAIVYHQHHGKKPAGQQTNDIQGVSAGQTVHTYGTDDKFEILSPQHPNAALEGPVLLFCRFACAPLCLPLEQLLSFFGNMSYSSSKAAILEVQKSFHQTQRQFVHAYLLKVRNWQIMRAIEEGRVVLPAGMELKQALKCILTGPKFPSLDSLKDAQSDMLAVDSGKETLHSLMASQGRDYHDWLEERAGEIKDLRERGIPIYHHTASAMIDPTQRIGPQPGTPSIPPERPDTDPDAEPLDED